MAPSFGSHQEAKGSFPDVSSENKYRLMQFTVFLVHVKKQVKVGFTRACRGKKEFGKKWLKTIWLEMFFFKNWFLKF